MLELFMVSTGLSHPFTTIIDEFFALKHISGRHGEMLRSMVRTRADSLLSHPDARYMPAFKILELLAALVDIAAAIASEPQLRPNEAQALMRESLSDGTPLVHQFLLEAALERVRYEPIMLAERPSNQENERAMVLQLRWAAMRAAHQEKASLPETWIDIVDAAAEQALTSPAFRYYRQGPLLQLLAEMLAKARSLHQSHADIAQLAAALAEDGPLWRRYVLKARRFREDAPTPPAQRFNQPPANHRLH
jgi:hypothetical protein